MIKVETEASALWREASATATPSTLDKRASPRLCGAVPLPRRFQKADISALPYR